MTVVAALVFSAGCQKSAPAPFVLPPPTTTATTQLSDGTQRSVTVYADRPVTETRTTPLPTTAPAAVIVATGPLPLLYRTASATRVRVIDADGALVVEQDVAGGLFVRVEPRGVFAGTQRLSGVPLRKDDAYTILVVPPADNESTQTHIKPPGSSHDTPPP